MSHDIVALIRDMDQSQQWLLTVLSKSADSAAGTSSACSSRTKAIPSHLLSLARSPASSPVSRLTTTNERSLSSLSDGRQ